MTGAILTCKHHDGFCLWPSKYSDHTVAVSPWKNGKGDLVKEFSDACREFGLKFGIYLSPWDQAEKTYGTGKEYDDFYVAQLSELLSNYGDIFEVWLDGANGEGAFGKVQVYDWKRYYETVRSLQPKAVISVCGPDVRWIGNEAGNTRKNEWSVVPEILQNTEKIASESQKVVDEKLSLISSRDEDLGSRERINEYDGSLVWYPAEVNTSIRPGWFYHQEEDELVKDAETLFAMYCRAVGGNACFLLNIPSNKEGLISLEDSSVLETLGKKISDLKLTSVLTAPDVYVSSSQLLNLAVLQERSEEYVTNWQAESDDEKPFIILSFEQPIEIDTVVLQENITESQRIEAGAVLVESNGIFEKIAEFGTIGYQRLISFNNIRTSKVKIEFREFRAEPAIMRVNLHKLS